MQISWRQSLLTTAFSVSAFFATSTANAQSDTLRADTTQWRQQYDLLKTNAFTGKDTIIDAQTMWPNFNLGNNPDQTLKFYRYLNTQAKHDGYNVSLFTDRTTVKAPNTKYNQIDKNLKTSVQNGAKPADQNAYLLSELNFDHKRAWPEYTMARYVIGNSPNTKLNDKTNLTYRDLLKATQKGKKPDYKNAAIVLQILAGMPYSADNLVSTPDITQTQYDALKKTANQLKTKAQASKQKNWGLQVFNQAVDTHHALINRLAQQYETKHATDLAQAKTPLQTVPARIKTLIPNLQVKRRTTDPKNQMTESIAGFYELVGHDAFYLLNAFANPALRQQSLSDFYAQDKRYNKKPGRAAQRARSVLKHAYLKPLQNAGYGDQFTLNDMMKTFTVQEACFFGTQRIVMPGRKEIKAIIPVSPQNIRFKIQKDTVNIETKDSIRVIHTARLPHNSIEMGGFNGDRLEAFNSDYTNTQNGRYGAVLTRLGGFVRFTFNQPLGKGKLINRGTDEKPNYLYRPPFFTIGESLNVKAGNLELDPRADLQSDASTLSKAPVTTSFVDIGTGVHVKAGPLKLYGFANLNHPFGKDGYDKFFYEQLRTGLGVAVRFFQFQWGKQKTTGVGLEAFAEGSDINRTLLNQRYNVQGPNDQPFTRPSVEPRAQAAFGGTLSISTKRNWSLNASVMRVNSNAVNFSLNENDAVKNTFTGGNQITAFQLSIKKMLNGRMSTRIEKSKDNKSVSDTIFTSPITFVDRALFSNFRRLAKQATMRDTMLAVAEPQTHSSLTTDSSAVKEPLSRVTQKRLHKIERQQARDDRKAAKQAERDFKRQQKLEQKRQATGDMLYHGTLWRRNSEPRLSAS